MAIVEPVPAADQPCFLASGDTALVVEFGDRVDQRLSGLVVALAHRLEQAAIPGVVEMMPNFRSLMVHYDSVELPQAELKRRLTPLLEGLEATGGIGRRWRIPACYHESLGVDLIEVAERMKLSPTEVIERHSATTFHVYMMGFLPGLPYLGGLPPEFGLPRRENPRIKVPKGAVAVASRHDRDLSPREPRRLAYPRAHARAAVGHGRRSPRAPRCRRQGDVRADPAHALRGDAGRGGGGRAALLPEESPGSRSGSKRA